MLTSLFSRTEETSEPFCQIYPNIIEKERLELLSEYTKPEKKLSQKHLEKGLRNHLDWNEFTETIDAFIDVDLKSPHYPAGMRPLPSRFVIYIRG